VNSISLGDHCGFDKFIIRKDVEQHNTILTRELALLKLKKSACIDASLETTWTFLSDLENISSWSETVLSSECKGERKKGIGAERTCRISKSTFITERWTSWKEGESYTYEGFDLPLVKSAKNTWSVKAENGKTLLTTESELVLKGGIFGRILEPLMLYISNRMGSDALSAFKYLVENGQPYAGKHSSLPRTIANC